MWLMVSHKYVCLYTLDVAITSSRTSFQPPQPSHHSSVKQRQADSNNVTFQEAKESQSCSSKDAQNGAAWPL